MKKRLGRVELSFIEYRQVQWRALIIKEMKKCVTNGSSWVELDRVISRGVKVSWVS